MSDQLNHMSGQFCSCSDILSEHFLLLIGNPDLFQTVGRNLKSNNKCVLCANVYCLHSSHSIVLFDHVKDFFLSHKMTFFL